MKKTIRTYIHTILFFLIPFIIISLILAILSYFIQLNSLTTHIIIQIVSYGLLIVSALYFTSQIDHQRLTHCFCFSLVYFLVSLFIHLGNLNYFHLFLKSLLFIFIGLYKEIRDRKLAQ